MLYCRDVGVVLVFYCCLNEVTVLLCYIIIFRIWINNRLSNKYHRWWCALAVCFLLGRSLRHDQCLVQSTCVLSIMAACSPYEWFSVMFTDTINLGVTPMHLLHHCTSHTPLSLLTPGWWGPKNPVNCPRTYCTCPCVPYTCPFTHLHLYTPQCARGAMPVTRYKGCKVLHWVH